MEELVDARIPMPEHLICGTPIHIRRSD